MLQWSASCGPCEGGSILSDVTSPDNPGVGKHWNQPAEHANERADDEQIAESLGPGHWLKMAQADTVEGETPSPPENQMPGPASDSNAENRAAELLRAEDEAAEANYGPAERAADIDFMEKVFEARELLDESFPERTVEAQGQHGSARPPSPDSAPIANVWRAAADRQPSSPPPVLPGVPPAPLNYQGAGQPPAFQPPMPAPPFNGAGPQQGPVSQAPYDNFAPAQSQFPPHPGPRPVWMPPQVPSGPSASPDYPAGPRDSFNTQPGSFGLWSQPGPGGDAGAGPAQYPAAGPVEPGARADYASTGHVSMEPTDSLVQKFNQQKYASKVKPVPQSGWRKGVLKLSGGLINPGESADERDDRLLRTKINDNIRGQFVFAVISLKGGVANTTTTAAIGSVFAETRGAEVIALDINPDSGNLAKRINPEAQHTFVDVLRDENIHGRTDVRSYTEHNEVKLDVLASSEALVEPPKFTPDTLIRTVDRMRRAYSVIALDCGKSIDAPIMPAVLDMVNALVVVSSVATDGGFAALKLHDWLRAHGRSQLLERSFLLLSDQTPKENPTVRSGIEDHVQKIIWKDPAYIPYDDHLHEAAVINLDQLQKPTYRAYLKATGRLAQWYNMPPLPLQSVGYRR